jgi:hypothetical protein
MCAIDAQLLVLVVLKYKTGTSHGASAIFFIEYSPVLISPYSSSMPVKRLPE